MNVRTALLHSLIPFAALGFGACGDDDPPRDAGINDGGMADGGMDPDSGMPPGTMFRAVLTGAEENPPVATEASGTTTFTLRADGETLDYVLDHNVSDATEAHIHRGQGGINGDVVVALDNLDGTPGTVTLTPDDRAELEAGRLYVNVHSSAFPTGEIRGQILLPDETLFVGYMDGFQETPPVLTTESGTIAIILSADRAAIQFDIETSFEPVAVHIHDNIAGLAGPIAYPLEPTASTISGTIAVTAEDVEKLTTGQWYANAHTSANPTGEVRGQILLPGHTVFSANLTGEQEVPEVTTTATGTGMLILEYAERGVRFHVVTSTDSPTAAHVHVAPGGLTGPVVIDLGDLGPVMTGTAAITSTGAAQLRRGLWYFNVHTASNPTGEVRGQILRPGEVLYTSLLSGDEEVPPVVTDATGGIGYILSADKSALRYDGAVMLVTPTDAHIHRGALGSVGPVVYPLEFEGLTLSGDTAVDPANLADLDGEGLYTNVHSAANPDGEIRGQVIRR